MLAPGLVLVGAGIGMCIEPLTTTALTHADAERAGAVSGSLSTMQQVGNSLGVAVTGVIIFGRSRPAINGPSSSACRAGPCCSGLSPS